ncbi:hypothetical protein [Micromonospora endophytica]|uniref:Uncharacterized protein n=1 Tax=Micromonospora endophytica TaxID=515350 RepID=A0A2W2DV22_9ACTN|nr:hypothetical protein [Micromonospora endophytica]PZG01017.1 hypothetical protein C1I93_00550 [Micromonospora endophytica]RIW47942.1 hypothetical protein D3H59_08700 [Micromonospora endophytica]BCJ62321.1 hypothetical protein Jiend_57430 [Micromonospora endophytica]
MAISFQHARYPALIELLPGLLADAQRGHAHDPRAGRVPLVEAYRVTASLLVKLGETELAARAYLQLDDPANAARRLLDADLIAPAEVRHRPAARDVLAHAADHPEAPRALVALAAIVEVSRT